VRRPHRAGAAETTRQTAVDLEAEPGTWHPPIQPNDGTHVAWRGRRGPRCGRDGTRGRKLREPLATGARTRVELTHRSARVGTNGRRTLPTSKARRGERSARVVGPHGPGAERRHGGRTPSAGGDGGGRPVGEGDQLVGRAATRDEHRGLHWTRGPGCLERSGDGWRRSIVKAPRTHTARGLPLFYRRWARPPGRHAACIPDCPADPRCVSLRAVRDVA